MTNEPNQQTRTFSADSGSHDDSLARHRQSPGLPPCFQVRLTLKRSPSMRSTSGPLTEWPAATLCIPHPGVLIWPDAFGLRPAKRQMAKRLAESGYSVLVVNQYYRSQRAPIVSSNDFSEVSGIIRPLMGTLNPDTQVTDARAFVGWLDEQNSVDSNRKMGTMGYCMGGPFVMRTAATLPDRVGAGASFHGGGLVTDGEDSPHLLIPQMEAHLLIAIASNDDENEPEAKNILRDAFASASVPAEIEVYDALHGWCPPDSRVYDEALAERAWTRMLATFEEALG